MSRWCFTHARNSSGLLYKAAAGTIACEGKGTEPARQHSVLENRLKPEPKYPKDMRIPKVLEGKETYKRVARDSRKGEHRSENKTNGKTTKGLKMTNEIKKLSQNRVDL